MRKMLTDLLHATGDSIKSAFGKGAPPPKTPENISTVTWRLPPNTTGKIERIAYNKDATSIFVNSMLLDYENQETHVSTEVKGSPVINYHKMALSATDHYILKEAGEQFKKLGGVVNHKPRTWGDPQPVSAAPETTPQAATVVSHQITDISLDAAVDAPQKAVFRKAKKHTL